ncbi:MULTISPECIES: DMT family transporter [unclassified Methylophilus]|uniref:DMT family transporter n=1 Tax=unclassified Methylophilus TaxID=2630143 RepID=UPI00037DA585|nr:MULTISPECIES: DMT family transporter [unclassified Methylophilus]
MANPSSTKLDWRTLVLLLLPPLFWAGNFIAGRAVSADVPPVALSLIRWGLATLCLLPFALKPFLRDRAHYLAYRWHVLGTAVTGVATFNLLVYWGLHTTSATNGIILNSFIPFLVAIFGFLLYRQHLPGNQLLGLLVSLAGVLTVVSHGDLQVLLTLAFAPGDIIIFLAMICWALFTVWLKQIPATIDRSGLMLCQVLIALALLLPLYAWESQTTTTHIEHAQTIWTLLYIGIFPSVIAFLAYAKAVSLVGSVRASVFIHAMPIFGSLLSSLLLKEPFHGYQLLGMLTIFCGIWLANRQANTSPTKL